jgi:hypothetical protein
MDSSGTLRNGTLGSAVLTAERAWVLPNTSGTMALASGTMSFQEGCSGTATASSTLYMPAPGDPTVNCTDGVGKLGQVMTSAGTLPHLRVNALTAGKTPNSGVFTVYDGPTQLVSRAQ